MCRSETRPYDVRILSDERGSAPVEFVLVGLLLTALTLGVLQLGVALYVRNVVHDAAVEGAYRAGLADTADAEGAVRTREIVARALGDAYPVDVAVRDGAGSGGAHVEVVVRATVPLVGVYGIPAAWEVTGRAPRESLE